MVDFLLRRRVADRTNLVPKHARVTPLMATGVNQLPLLALIEGHLTARTQRATGFVFQNLSNRCQI